MSAELAKEILKKNNSKADPQKCLVQWVNDHLGLRLPVTKVYTTL